jgi:hypothetical protein
MSQPSPRRSPRRQPGAPPSPESVGAEAQGERSSKDAQSLANWRQTFGAMQRQAAKENQKRQAAEKAAAQAKAKEAQKVSSRDKGKKRAAEKELEEEEEDCQVERAQGAKIAKNRVTKPIAQKKKQKSEHDVKWGTLITYPARLKDVEFGDCLRVDRAAHEIYCKACKKTIGGRLATITAHLGISASKTNTGKRHQDNYKRWKTSQSIFVLNEAYVKVCTFHALYVRACDACVCVCMRGTAARASMLSIHGNIALSY